MHSFRLNNEDPTEQPDRMDEPDSNDRKRRRITLTQSTTAPAVRSVNREPAGSTLPINNTPPVEAETWNYLAKWEETDDNILGGIDEEEEEYLSDVSDEYPGGAEDADADADSDEDDELPYESQVARPSKLGTAKVVEIINDCIEKYATAWSPGKGETKHKDDAGQTDVPVAYDVVALWEEAEAAGQREEYAEKYALEAEYYRQRLDKLCEEITKDPGDTIASVQHVSVHSGFISNCTNFLPSEMSKPRGNCRIARACNLARRDIQVASRSQLR